MNNNLIGKVVKVSKDGITWYKRKLFAIIAEPTIRKKYITDVRELNGTVRAGETSKWVYCKPLSAPKLISFEQARSCIGEKFLFSDSLFPTESLISTPSTLREIIINADGVSYVTRYGASYRYVFREDTDERDLFKDIDNQ